MVGVTLTTSKGAKVMKGTLVILIHGFNVTDGGAGTVRRLKPFYQMRGANVTSLRYGWFGLLRARFCNEEVSENLARLITRSAKTYSQIIVVGHSNGCAIAHLASFKCSEQIHRFVYINPALKLDYAPAQNVKGIDVWHNAEDNAVLWAKLLFWRAKERPWGLMGRTGYKGNDSRFVNFDTANDFSLKVKGHSAVFKKKVIGFFGLLIADVSMNVETARGSYSALNKEH